MVQLIGSSAAHVSVWDARRPGRRVGTLYPRGSLVPNSTDQLLVKGVRSGDVITVIAPDGTGLRLIPPINCTYRACVDY